MRRNPLAPDEIARCKAAMSKPAPMQALRLIASGRVIIEVTPEGDILIDRFDGKRVRDPDHPDCKMGLAGAWPLLAAGMIDEFGVITEAGRLALSEREGGER
ncbi:hypothetical protein MMMDOFMJ_1707 [Methylobacterium gnaphalii]|uniref:Uncharacterized protein n=2 Tax=Methylobacterium gnaphalii TaxID=1010610 RepID=A0A512JP40_9HYPH|nr:hypothetical protein MGN01_35470 [Methylobacterium gnaphalii]GJD68783.1 hypothetical protein MMMDOFMJ_1707 [Methylobacterium gnaphalii]GLS50199.1 hypothetical protein GCM10007885_30510 [Methylobacterium gnaphalii]